MLKRFVLICLFIPVFLFGQNQFRIAGEPTKLTGGDNAYFHSPVWSPDGRMIAFTGSNYKGLWVLDMETNETNQLSDEAGVGFGFEWSADSRDIAVRASRYENAHRQDAIKLLSVENKTETNLSGYRDKTPGLPQWTSDNRQIYFYNGKALEFFETGKLAKTDVNRPLYFTKYGKIFSQVYPTDQAGSDRLVIDDNCLDVRISPDGKKISYQVMGGNLFVVNVDGSGRSDLGKGHNARWSPDSEYLVYMVTADDGHDFTSSDLYISRVDGSMRLALTDSEDQMEMNPSWSPQGDRIVYNAYRDGALYLIRIMR